MNQIDYSTFLPVREFSDRGIKWLLESKENLEALLDIVAEKKAKNMDFSKLEKLPISFIPDNLRKQESDLLFLVPFRDEADKLTEVMIYILIEHQSTPDRVMNFRVLFYMLQIWDRQRREWVDKDIPKGQWDFRPILPIVFYTGEQSWAKMLSMAELMDLPKALERFVPHHDTIFLNLKTKPKEELTVDYPSTFRAYLGTESVSVEFKELDADCADTAFFYVHLRTLIKNKLKSVSISANQRASVRFAR